MSSKSYEAWQVDESDFPSPSVTEEQFKFLLRYAILAPSTHNTQPWRFKVDQSSITVLPYSEKILPASDPHGREAYISLGCCLENLIIAAHYFRFQTEIELFPSDGSVAIVHLTSNASIADQNTQNLFHAIVNRKSAKLDYTKEVPPAHVLSRFNKIASSEQGLNLLMISDEKERKEIAGIVEEGTRLAMSDKAFREELSHWVIHNYSDSGEGMPGSTTGVPGPFSLIVPLILRTFDLGKPHGRKMAAQVMNTPLLCTIAGKSDTKEYWLAAGRLFERIALLAVHNGFATAAMGAPTEVDSMADRLRKVLCTSNRPLVFFRLGKPKKPVLPSPRRSLEECLVT